MRALLLVLAIVVAGCAQGATQQPAASAVVSSPAGTPDAGVRVVATLGIYSGRPDPSWALSPTESSDLAARIGALSTDVGVPPEGGLGYHGFSILITATGRADRRFVAYRGTLAGEGTGRRPLALDPTRSIERYLLAVGSSHLVPNEIAEVEADLAW